MVSQLSDHFGADLSSIQDMLASISAPVPPALATAPPALATAFEEDFDLEDFWCILFLFKKYYNIIWLVIQFEYFKYIYVLLLSFM